MKSRFVAISNHANMLGGGEHSFLNLLSNLPEPWHVIAIIPEKKELYSKLNDAGIGIKVAPLPTIRPWTIHRILLALKSYVQIIRNCHPDIVYANGSRAALYGGLAAMLLGVPLIWHCRIAERDMLLDFILKRLCWKIIANSKATANRFLPGFKNKVCVVYNGVDLRWLKEEHVLLPTEIQPHWKIILMVARVSRWKRHDLALSAFDRVAEIDKNCHLVCIGAKDRLELDWWEHLQERTRISVHSDRIHWIGQIDDVRPWYRAATICILPSENEPFGRVIVEAMACGVPIIAARSGGVPEIIQHGESGLLFTPGRVDELVAAMEKVLCDDELRINLSNGGKKRARRFDLASHTNQVLRIFKTAAQRIKKNNERKTHPS